MTFVSLVLSLVLVGLLAPQSATIQEIALNQPFDLRQGEAGQERDSKLRIEFISVPEDSRCAKGEQCISAGNGQIELKLIHPDQEAEVVHLNTAREPGEAFYHGFKIKLVLLNPYPRMNSFTKPSDYVATLVVSESASDSKGE